MVADCLFKLPPEDKLPPLCTAAVWLEDARLQVDLDRVPCQICNSVDAWDNMVTCDGCDRRMHLRCLIPPQTGAPSGQFFCPACDVGCGKFCCTPCGCKTPLRYNSGQDPHINEVLIKYLCSGREEACLPLKC